LFATAGVVALIGFAILGADLYRVNTDPEFRRTPNFRVTFQTPSCSKIFSIRRPHSPIRAILASLLALSLLRRPIRVLQISTPPARTLPPVRI